MRIKHKETTIEKSLSFGDWIREYVRKELYKDWEVLNLDDVFKVQTLFNENGRVSITLMSGNDARNHKNKSNGVSVNILKEPVKMEFYKEYLETKILKTKNQRLSFLSFFKYQKPSIKFDTHRKRHMTIVVLMILTLLGMFYIAYKQGVFN